MRVKTRVVFHCVVATGAPEDSRTGQAMYKTSADREKHRGGRTGVTSFYAPVHRTGQNENILLFGRFRSVWTEQ